MNINCANHLLMSEAYLNYNGNNSYDNLVNFNPVKNATYKLVLVILHQFMVVLQLHLKYAYNFVQVDSVPFF